MNILQSFKPLYQLLIHCTFPVFDYQGLFILDYLQLRRPVRLVMSHAYEAIFFICSLIVVALYTSILQPKINLFITLCHAHIIIFEHLLSSLVCIRVICIRAIIDFFGNIKYRFVFRIFEKLSFNIILSMAKPCVFLSYIGPKLS